MTDVYSSIDAQPYTPDIERLANEAKSNYEAYPSPQKVADTEKKVSAIKEQEMAETEPARNRQIGRIRSDVSNIDTKYRSISPVNVKPWKPEEHPISSPLEAFGSYAGVFAMLASAVTRQPIENTLNAGAAAINSVRNADLAGLERAHTAWKENTDLAFKSHEAEREDYQDAITKMKAGQVGAEAEMAAVAAKYGDKVVKTYLDAGMSPKALETIKQRNEIADKYFALQPTLMEIGKQQYLATMYQSEVNKINEKRRQDGQPLLNGQQLTQLYGQMKDQFTTGNEEKSQARELSRRAVDEEKAKRAAEGRPPLTAQEEAQIVGDVHRSATQNFGAFSGAKMDEVALERRAQEIMEKARESGNPISLWQARLMAKQEMKDATASATNREKVGSIQRAKDRWLDEHPEANGVVPTEVENSIRAKANARAIASAEPSISDKSSKLLAERVIAGDRTALTGLGYGAVGAANRARVINDVTEMAAAKGMDGAALARRGIEYAATGAGARSLAQLEARTTGAITKAQATAPRVLEISDKIDRTRFPSVNSIILAAQKGTGGENVVRLGVAVETFINNYALALGAGASNMTDSSKQHARELLEKAYSKGQMSAAVDQMLIEMDSELAGIKVGMKQYLDPAHTSTRATQIEPDPIHVNTPEEAKTYPSGTKIIMPDGTAGTVP